MVIFMSFLAFAALVASQPLSGPLPKTVFTVEEVSTLQQKAKRKCGYATPRDLMLLTSVKREKMLPCLIQATVEQSGQFLPKNIERGATIVSVSNFQGLPIFVVQFSPDHPRASVPKEQTSDYDRLLSTWTCNDKWLGSSH